MSAWRWLLFRAMAYAEFREDAYLGLSNPTTVVAHRVLVRESPDRYETVALRR